MDRRPSPTFNYRRDTLAWSTALAQGKKFAEDCMCACDNITVVFVCAGQDALRMGKPYCGKKEVIACKKNARRGGK